MTQRERLNALRRLKELQAKAQGGDEPGLGMQAARSAEFFSRGFMDSAADTVGAIPELASSALRTVGLPTPEAGYYPSAIKEGMRSFGQTISAPLNALIDFCVLLVGGLLLLLRGDLQTPIHLGDPLTRPIGVHEDRLHTVVVNLRNRVEFVAVTARALNGQSHRR